MSLFVNRVHDAVAAAFVRWVTASPDTGGASYPGPDAFGNTTDFCIEAVTDSGGVTDHGALIGLGDDDHAQYLLLLGRSGGQSVLGGTLTGNTLTLRSNSTDAPGVTAVVINDDLDMSTRDITNAGNIAGVSGDFSEDIEVNGGASIDITAGGGTTLELSRPDGDAGQILLLTSTVGVSGSNAAQFGVHAGDRDPNSNIDANEGTVYVQVGVGTSTIWIKNTASGTLTGWTDLATTSSTPAGSDTEVQFNNSGAFGADPNFTWDGSELAVTGVVTSTVQFTVVSAIPAPAFAGTTASGDATPILSFDTTGGSNGALGSLVVGNRDPNTLVAGPAGALYARWYAK